MGSVNGSAGYFIGQNMYFLPANPNVTICKFSVVISNVDKCFNTVHSNFFISQFEIVIYTFMVWKKK